MLIDVFSIMNFVDGYLLKLIELWRLMYWFLEFFGCEFEIINCIVEFLNDNGL